MPKVTLTVGQLRQAMPRLPLSKASAYLEPLQAAMDEFGISKSRLRVCAFLSNLGHESGDLTKWVENMSYSAKRLLQVFPKYFKTSRDAELAAHRPEYIAMRVYGGRMGNNTGADGWKYIARGPIGITGREMYQAVGDALHLQLVAQPELAEKPQHGFRIAAWVYAVEKHLLPVSDKLRGTADRTELKFLTTICRGINGGTNGLDDRVIRYSRLLKIIPSAVDADDATVTISAFDLSSGKTSTVSIPVQDLTPPTSGDVVTNVSTSGTGGPAADDAGDFSKLLKNEALKNTAKAQGVRGLKMLWRPATTVFGAIQAGNMFAISGTVLLLLVAIVLLCLYQRELRTLAMKAYRIALDYFTK